jgi:hypothetical protein
MFFNTATNEVFPGSPGVLIVPCAYQRKFVEWVPRERGGGYRGDWTPEKVRDLGVVRDDGGKYQLDNGNRLSDTRYFFCLHVRGLVASKVVVAFASTQIKKARQWMTMMTERKIDGATPPMFAHLCRLSTVAESNEKGHWRGYKVSLERVLDPGVKGDTETYDAARSFYLQTTSGMVRPETPVDPTVDDSEIPF